MSYKKLKDEVYEKCNGRCAYCGDPININVMQTDHIVPQRNWKWIFQNKHITASYHKHVPEFLRHLTETDLNHIDNLNPACRVCNKWKSAHYLELFRSELQDQLSRLNARSANFRIAKRFGQIEETPKPIIFYFETLTNKSKNPSKL